MSRITIHLKRAGDQLRDPNNNNLTTLSSPKTIFFNRHRRHSSTQFWDHPYPFDTTVMPEDEEDSEDPRRLSADQMPLPQSSSPSIIHDQDVAAEHSSTAPGSSSSAHHHHHHHDIIHKPLPLVIARPKIHDIQIV